MSMVKLMKKVFSDLEKDYQNELDRNKAVLFGAIICNADEGAISVISKNIKEDAWSKLELLHNNQSVLELVDESLIISKTFFILCGEDQKIAKELFNYMINNYHKY